MKSTNNWKIFYCICILLFSFFVFKNLGNAYLWQDEGKAAFLAKTISIDGYPKAYDGKNFIRVEESTDSSRIDNYAWRYHPWLQYYLIFFSFKITGIENAFTARLPFAIFGILSLLIFIKLSNNLFKDKIITAIGTILFTFSIPLLLHIRHARWYSLAIFFSLVIVYYYQKIFLRSEKKHYGILFGIANALLFHSNYLIFFLLFLVLFLHFIILIIIDKKILKKIFWKNIIFGLFLCFLLTLPFYLYVNITDRLKFMNITNILKIMYYLKAYNLILYDYFLSVYVFAIGIICWFITKTKQYGIRNLINKPFKDLFFELNIRSISLLFLITFAPIIPLVFARDFYFRYIIWMMPFALLLIAIVLKSILKFNLILGLSLIIYSAFYAPYNINCWKLIHNYEFKNFIYEIFHDYDGPIEGIVKYLNENGNKNQVVAINYDDPSIMFYTGIKVIVGSSGFVFNPDGKEIIPDWVIPRRVHFKGRKEKMLEEYLEKYNYKKILINYPNIIYEYREDPYQHNYRTVKNTRLVEIYQLIKPIRNK